MRRRLVMVAAVLSAMLPASSSSGRGSRSVTVVARPFDGSLSVMTYNVKGLPWPVGWGRSSALDAIGKKLAAMRAVGRGPAVVVLQEAFSSDAARMIEVAGYPYMASGPNIAARNADPGGDAARRFARSGSWLKGEGVGKFVGSGLAVMSEYPIVRVRRSAFPAFACAGYDCLANKGVLLVTLRLPDGSAVDVATTHLNSRRASGASDARSLYAYRAEVAALERFVRYERDPAHPLVVAGDFNVGRASQRATALRAAVTGWSGADGARDVFGSLAATRRPLSIDADWSRRRRKDWQFFDGGDVQTLSAVGVDVPFGRDAAGAMLSDHVGYTARYRLIRRS